MLDDSFLYQKDFDKYYKKFQKQDLGDLYKSLYSNGRLTELGDADPQGTGEFLSSYSRNLKLINELVRDNYHLQHRVHQLGLKNRARRLLGKYAPSRIRKLGKYAPPRVRKLWYVPPETVRSYVTQTELEDILNSTFISKNFLPLVSFSRDALKLFKNLSDESFESGLRNIQKQISSPRIKNPPLISIVIPTRNGLHHLKRLFSNFSQSTGYSNFEIIVVDNGSSDGTKAYLNELKEELNLRVISNPRNKSFSESNNIAAKKAKGSYLLFLNNDISPTEGWLNHMMNTILKGTDIGAAGAKLVYPYKPGFENSYKIQHGGLGFRLEDDFIRPINLNMGAGFLTRNIKREEEKAGVTAACLLIEKTKFDEVGGFDGAYWYGYEDVDLCLKLRDKGYRNIINNAAVLFHHEFGTQSEQDERTISNSRKKNIEVFKSKWQKQLYPKLWQSLLGEDGIYTDKKLHIGFVVTEASDKTATGDYYTAKELGSVLQGKGCKVSYIGIRNSPDPYDLDPDVDVLISMIDGYDIGKLTSNKAVKIAWCRNWFERWADHDYFRNFDIVLTNSEKAQQFFREKFFIDSYVFKIATNKDRFTRKFTKEELAGYQSDICFTGNYWHVPRDISDLFDTDRFKDRYKIKIFGKDWGHVKKLKSFWEGFIEYKNLPKVYAAGKILIDDATFVVNQWGAVNSRVFDGAASGILVLTNGVEGSKHTFGGLIPTFNTKEELSELLETYLNDEKLRQKKINEIRNYALAHHTYEHRADQLLGIFKKELTQKRINIKLPIPHWSEAKQWGDLHFGNGLRRELEKRGFNIKLQILPDWDRPNFAFANLVLRGLSIFNPPDHQLNIMWNISHPEKVPIKEYREYDYVFVASGRHIENLKKKRLKNVHILYQCFDDTVFNIEPAHNPADYMSDILFVGNTRNHFRKIVRDIISWKDLGKYNFKVYGQGWEKFINKKYIAGEFIENSELKYYYQNTKILLNDHWDDMNEYAIVSNRLFDASACGTFIISDANPGIKDIFGPNVIEEYKDPSSLHQLLDKYLNDPEIRRARAEKARSIVFKNHTFAHRTNQIISFVSEL